MEKLTKEQKQELDQLHKEIRELRNELKNLVEACGYSEYIQISNNLDYRSKTYGSNYVLFAPDKDFGKTRIDTYDADIARTPDFEKWKDTFFYTDRFATVPIRRSILADYMTERLRHGQKYHPSFVSNRDFLYGKYLVSTEAVIPTENGPRFLFSDPYGSIITDPCSEIDMDYAESLIGKIVVAEIGHRFDSDSHPLRKLRVTDYYKYESEHAKK